MLLGPFPWISIIYFGREQQQTPKFAVITVRPQEHTQQSYHRYFFKKHESAPCSLQRTSEAELPPVLPRVHDELPSQRAIHASLWGGYLHGDTLCVQPRDCIISFHLPQPKSYCMVPILQVRKVRLHRTRSPEFSL